MISQTYSVAVRFLTHKCEYYLLAITKIINAFIYQVFGNDGGCSCSHMYILWNSSTCVPYEKICSRTRSWGVTILPRYIVLHFWQWRKETRSLVNDSLGRSFRVQSGPTGIVLYLCLFITDMLSLPNRDISIFFAKSYIRIVSNFSKK